MSVAGSKSGLRYSPNAITCAEVNRDMMQVEKVRTRASARHTLRHTDVNTSRAKSRVLFIFPGSYFDHLPPWPVKTIIYPLYSTQSRTFRSNNAPFLKPVSYSKTHPRGSIHPASVGDHEILVQVKKTGRSFAFLAIRQLTRFDLGICGSDVCL